MDTKNYGLENVFPFKQGVILGIYVRFQGGNISHLKGKLGKSLTQKTGSGFCFLKKLTTPEYFYINNLLSEKTGGWKMAKKGVFWEVQDGDKSYQKQKPGNRQSSMQF